MGMISEFKEFAMRGNVGRALPDVRMRLVSAGSSANASTSPATGQ